MKRRTFLLRVGGGLLAVPAVLKMSACGSDNGGGTPDSGPATAFTATNQDNSGHGHTFTVQCADLTSSNEVTYTAVDSGHTHDVTLTAEELAMIDAGQTVTVETDSIHPHTWVISKGNAC